MNASWSGSGEGSRGGLDTRASLLLRLRDPRDHEAWTRFLGTYGPMIEGYARRRGLSRSEAEDVRDACLEVVARKITDFEYDAARGRFKSWLYRIASTKVVDQIRRRSRTAGAHPLEEIPDPSPGPDAVWEIQWLREHVRDALEEVRKEVPVRTWRIFSLLVREERHVEDVCRRLDVSPDQVYRARAKILARLRARLED